MARKSRKPVAADNCTSGNECVEHLIYNVGAYVRLSALDRKQKGDSIETQQAIIKAHIEQHSDLSLRETYIDNGLSGMTFVGF